MSTQRPQASAAAFAPRCEVVLGSEVEHRLAKTVKGIGGDQPEPLDGVHQHQKNLEETLSSHHAIWTLASLMLPKAPESELRQDDNPLVEALSNYQLVNLEAYVVNNIHCVDAKADIYDWPEKEEQCKKLHEDFVQAVNNFVLRTHVSALEGLEEEGRGELLGGKADEVTNNVLGLMKAMLPPPGSQAVEAQNRPPLDTSRTLMGTATEYSPSSPVLANMLSNAMMSLMAAYNQVAGFPCFPTTMLPVQPDSFSLQYGNDGEQTMA